MASSAVSLSGGGIKRITYYSYTGIANSGGIFNIDLAISAVDSISKTDVIINGYMAAAGADPTMFSCYLETTTNVKCATTITNASARSLSLKVVEYY